MVTYTYSIAMAQVFKDEGGYTNDPKDPGGPTNWGITIYDAKHYWKADATAEDVETMPKSVAEAIYVRHYADPIYYSSLPAGVDYAILDYAINSGIARAVRCLQSIVGVEQDGFIGPITIAACNNHNSSDIVNSIYDQRLAFLKSLSTWEHFQHGWTDRCTHGRALALLMVQQDKERKPMTTNNNIVLADIEQALQSLNTSLPTILSVVGMFVPQVAAFSKFIPLIQVAIQGVDVVAKATGTDASAATATVAQHLTPGEPNAPELS